MKFTVERDALAEAVTWVARALPARPVVPVLSGLLLTADQPSAENNGGGFLLLSCFDYEVSARMRIRAEVAEPGTVLVPGRLLVEIVRSLPPLAVTFGDDRDPDGISVTCGDAAFTVTPLPGAEYPELPELPELAGTVDGGVFAGAISQVTPAASRDDTLPMLTAVNLELDGATMTLAATDRYRLAVRDLDWQPAPGFAGQGRTAFLVPARTLADTARMMSPATEVRLMFRQGGDRDANGVANGGGGSNAADAMIGFETGERRLTTRLLAGEFIRYRFRFPAEFACTADVPAEAFAEAVHRVSLVAERGTPVQLTFAPGRVTIGAATQGTARARESVPADFTGDEQVIAFSPHYLLDGLAAAVVAVVSRGDDPAVVSRGDDPPYPPHVAAGGSDGKERHRIGPASGDEAGVPVSGDEAGVPVSGDEAGVAAANEVMEDSADDRREAAVQEAAHGTAGFGPDATRVRLQFSGPAKPAVITRQPDPDAKEGGSAFRYLVVPQRVVA